MARIGDTVRPELMRADTSGILRGSAAGAAALGQGLASGMQSIAGGIRAGKEAKGEIAGGRKFAKAMLDMHGEASDIGKQMLTLIEFFDDPERRQSEQLGVVKYMTPIVGALTQKSAQDIAAIGRKVEKRRWRKGHRLDERRVVVAEDLAEAAKTEAGAKMLAAQGQTGEFDEFGTRIGVDGRMEYFSPGIAAMDLELVKDLAARKDALSNVDFDITQLEEFREIVGEHGSSWLQYAQTAFGHTWASKYQQKFMQFKQDFAQRLAKARNGVRVTDADVENAKKALFSLNMSKDVNLDIIDGFINELKSRAKEVQAADTFLKTNGKMLGYTSTHPELWEGSGVGGGTGAGGTGAGGATSRLGGLRARSEGTGDTGRVEATTTGPDGRPVAGPVTGPEAAEFTQLLRDSKFTARDLEKFRTGTDAEMGALLDNLRAGAGWSRGGRGPILEVGRGLSAEDKLSLMEQFVNPTEEVPQRTDPGYRAGEPTTLDPTAPAGRRIVVPAVTEPAGAPPISGPAPLPPESVREGQPAIYNPRLEGLSPEQIRPIQFGDPLSPEQEAHRRRQVEELEQKGGSEEIEFRDTRYEIPGGSATLSLGDQKFRATTEDEGTRLSLEELLPEPARRRIPDEIKSSSTLQGSRLPKTTMTSTRELTYAPEAKLRVIPEFSPSFAERQSLRKRGILLVNLDANHSGNKKGTKTPLKRVVEPVMVIPDGASGDTKQRARTAVQLMDDLYARVHGTQPKAKVSSRVRTTTENSGRGRVGILHTELFAVTDNKMVNYLKTNEGAREYTGILRRAFGDREGLRWFLPHSEKRQGATTDKGSSEVDLALHFMKFL